MKKLLLSLLGALTVYAVPTFAETVNVGPDGKVWIERPEPVLSKVEVTFDQGVLEHGDYYWKQAFIKKGTVVPVKMHVESRRNGLFHVENVTFADVGVVYDGMRMRVVHGVAGEPRVSYTPYAIFWLVSMMLMTASVWNMIRGKGRAATVAVFFTIIITFALGTLPNTFALDTLPSILPTGAGIFAGIAAVADAVTPANKKDAFYGAIVAYYIAMIASMVAFLSS